MKFFTSSCVCRALLLTGLYLLAATSLSGQVDWNETGISCGQDQYESVPGQFFKKKAARDSVDLTKHSLREYCSLKILEQDSLESTCGPCAVAGARTILYNISQDSVSSDVFSPSFLYQQIKSESMDCRAGTLIEQSLNLLRDQGICWESTLPFQCGGQVTDPIRREAYPFRILGYQPVFEYENNKNAKNKKTLQIKYWLSKGIPVIVGMQVAESFKDTLGDYWVPKRGEKPEKIEDIEEGHSVVVVAYDDNYKIPGRMGKGAFLLMNSWGESWGGGGFKWVPYSVFKKWIFAAWSIFPLPDESHELAPKNNMHIIVVADTESAQKKAAKTAQLDARNAMNHFTSIAHKINYRPKPQFLVGPNFTASDIDKTLKDLEVNDNDIIVFYFSGNSKYNGITPDGLPVLAFDKGKGLLVNSIKSSILEKGARFNLILIDSGNKAEGALVGNSKISTGPSKLKELPEDFYEFYEIEAGLKTLFLDVKGLVIGLGASPGENAYGHHNSGSFFTNAFLETLYQNSGEYNRWRIFANQVSSKTAYAVLTTRKFLGQKTQHPMFLVELTGETPTPVIRERVSGESTDLFVPSDSYDIFTLTSLFQYLAIIQDFDTREHIGKAIKSLFEPNAKAYKFKEGKELGEQPLASFVDDFVLNRRIVDAKVLNAEMGEVKLLRIDIETLSK